MLSLRFNVIDRRGHVKAIEVSVLWHTEGKGDVDEDVIHRERLVCATGAGWDTHDPPRCEVRLPRSPLSYDGVILKIHWCVRAQVIMKSGREMLVEAPFRLGKVPPARKERL
jgi:hypothetical protein